MNGKKAVFALIVVFLGFWMLSDPSGLAATSKDAGAQGWDLTQQLFDGVIDFFGAL